MQKLKDFFKIPEILKTQRFLPLLGTQFFGALNDNLFKNMLLIFVAHHFPQNCDVLSNVIASLLIIPFFLFSATAGQMADKYTRSKITVILKIIELVLMLFVVFVYAIHSLPCLILLLCLMGAQSAFFGPVKYALLPQLLKDKELVAGNAYVEATTYLGIMLGLILGTLLPFEIGAGLLILFALIGLFASTKIPHTPAPRPHLKIQKNIFKEILSAIQEVKQYPTVYRCILGATWFWTVGSLMAVQVFSLNVKVFNGVDGLATFFLILFSVGVGVGSLLCNKLLKGAIHATYVPFASIGMGLCSLFLFLATKNYPYPETTTSILAFITSASGMWISIIFLLLAFFGGLYIVPLNTLMQHKAPPKITALVIGTNNILNAFGMATASIVAILLLKIGFTVPDLFLCVAILSLFVSVYICMILPEALIRSALQFILKLCFRVKVNHLEIFKKASKNTILIANHTSLLDALLLIAFIPEKLTFAINAQWRKKWFVRAFSSLIDLYPIEPTNPMAMRGLIDEAKKGKKIMLFPEGRITVTGGLMKVYEGAGVIADKAGCQILPLRIDGAILSKFSYISAKAKTFYFPSISMTFLPPETFKVDEQIKGKNRRAILSRQLYDLMTKMMYQTSYLDKHLFVDLLEASKKYGKNHIIAEDINRKPIKYKELILKSYVLGEAYQSAFIEDKIGLMIPNTLACLVSFFALQAVGKTPVMMNFSHGTLQIASCAKTVGLNTVISSSQFIQQAHLEKQVLALTEAGVKIIYLEDFSQQISLLTKLKGIKNYLQKKKPIYNSSQTAVILFTSGSEGLPKAVLLSHRNLQANRYQVASVISLNPADIFMNALPMFHSFGLTIGGIVSILSGVRTFYYPSPLHYRVVPELFYDTNATVLCGTDTFLYGYGRRANPYDFYNLKYAIVGGEKLKDQTSNLWFEKFGVRILEGYGATETSPVICLNTPMYLKRGTVGRLLPGEEIKLEKVPGIDQGGRLIIKGDNIMQGYMRPEKPMFLDAPKGNWYDTGDIVQIDEEGFIKITGRAKRFAKIAGEMVSLSAVEEVINQLYPNSVAGIISLPDEKRGEQLVLIINQEGIKPSVLRESFKQKGLNELWAPRQVVFMQKPPLLGTGKFDYLTAKKIVLESAS